MDGENKGKPYEQMDDMGFSHIFGSTHISLPPTVSNSVFLKIWHRLTACGSFDPRISPEIWMMDVTIIWPILTHPSSKMVTVNLTRDFFTDGLVLMRK